MKPTRFWFIVTVVVTLFLAATVWAQEVQTYTVQSGDTLWSISEKFYGNKDLWPKLWEANKYNTANPHRISIGDNLTIYPLETLQRTASPHRPPEMKSSLYDRGKPLDTIFPEYFAFVADPAGIGGTGINRVKVKKIDPLTGRMVVTYDEIRNVGQIIATEERGYEWPTSWWKSGKILLSYNDIVIVRFTEDIAKILDSATHEDPDPYYREFPIYGSSGPSWEPDGDRADTGMYLGRIHQFRGKLKVVARVETLAPIDLETAEDMARLRRRPFNRELSGRNMESEPVSYVCKITYSERPIEIGDRIFMFKSYHPGPERFCDTEWHEAGQFKPGMTP